MIRWLGRWATRGFAVLGAVVVAWTSFSWAKLSRERWREQERQAVYGSWPSHR